MVWYSSADFIGDFILGISYWGSCTGDLILETLLLLDVV